MCDAVSRQYLILLAALGTCTCKVTALSTCARCITISSLPGLVGAWESGNLDTHTSPFNSSLFQRLNVGIAIQSLSHAGT
jgi:hypothetical protein